MVAPSAIIADLCGLTFKVWRERTPCRCFNFRRLIAESDYAEAASTSAAVSATAAKLARSFKANTTGSS